jgi:hypothetical protein
MNDKRHEANELSELIDRVVLHGAENLGVESSLDEETVALVNDLRAMAQATPMREGFARELEERFLARETVPAGQHVVGEAPLRRFWAQLVQPFSQHRWATAAALGLLLTVTVALAGVGPQPVWADLQRLLGYVPGVGFVNLEETRVLMAPGEVTRNGVILRIEQVLARPDSTVIVIHSEGLPPEDQLWPHGAREDSDYQPRLRLSDGRTLVSESWTLCLGAGTLEFPPLPDDVYHVTLELPRLPLVPAGAAPEAWKVPLNLRPATGALVEELFPQPYVPTDAYDTHAGITLHVLEVAHSPQETALRFQVQWRDSDWEFHHIGGDQSPVLRDDLGHVYLDVVPSSSGSLVQTKVIRIPDNADEVMPTPTPTVPTYEQTKTFAPASPSAQRLTLWVDGLEFMVPAEGSFTVDLGDDPQVGDHWPLDVSLTVAGFPVHITGVQLVHEDLQLRDGSRQRTLLQFDIGLVPDQGDRTLRGLYLDGTAAGFSGSGSGYSRVGGLRASLDLREWQSIPSGSIRVWVRSAGVLIRGPWTITWTVPGADEARATPVTLHPANASQTRDDLTLRVDEVTLTDRLTAVTVGVEGPPPGMAFSRILTWNPATRRSELYLEDDRGRRYELSRDVSWRPSGSPESDAKTLTFQPVQPLARRMTLHAPSMEVTLAGAAAFDVTVPNGLTTEAHPGEVSASAPWGVDIPVEVAGYRLCFTQARLEELNGTTMLMLASGPFEGQQQGDRWLTGLRMASVTAPNGQLVDLRSAFSHAGPEYGARLAFDVVDPGTGIVQAGRYHVELEGVTVAVQGPWTLAWNLRAP